MNTASLDEKGVVVACPNCGRRNRIHNEQLNKAIRCGNCKKDIPGVNVPVDVQTEEVAAAHHLVDGEVRREQACRSRRHTIGVRRRGVAAQHDAVAS